MIVNSSTIINNIITMGGTCATDANTAEIAAAVLTIPQTLNTNNLTGTITYEYHYHESACKKECTGTMVGKGKGHNSYGQSVHLAECSVCGRETETYAYIGGERCGNVSYTCGYSNGQIIGATITY